MMNKKQEVEGLTKKIVNWLLDEGFSYNLEIKGAEGDDAAYWTVVTITCRLGFEDVELITKYLKPLNTTKNIYMTLDKNQFEIEISASD